MQEGKKGREGMEASEVRKSKDVGWYAQWMRQSPQRMARVGMERRSGHQKLKWSMMWEPGAWKYLLEVRIQCFWII